MAVPELPQSPGTIRLASVDEDHLLSRILCNAFLPIWNHNWFHGTTKPLRPVPVGGTSDRDGLMIDRTQACRIRFYLALIKLTRLLNGEVFVNEISTSESAQGTSRDIAAILLWLPPGNRLGSLEIGKLWQSGFLSLILPWNYGFTAFYRIDNIFEANIASMFEKTLTPRAIKADECGFVQMLAANPACARQGYASALLKFQVDQHFSRFPGVPVVLDTTTEQGVRAYTRLGFELLAEKPLDTGTDAMGIALKAHADKAVREAARKITVQRVMIRVP